MGNFFYKLGNDISHDLPIIFRKRRSSVNKFGGEYNRLKVLARILNEEGKYDTIGYTDALLSKVDKKNILPTLEVKPEYQGKGIGKELMLRINEWVDKEIPNKEIFLRAQPFSNKKLTREQLMEFYSRYGFVPVNKPGDLMGYDENNEPMYPIGTGPGAMVRVAGKGD